MVDLSPTERVRDVLTALGRFVAREVVPIERDLEARLGPPAAGADPLWHLDADGRLLPAVWEARREIARRSAAAGFYALHMPEAVGGGGLSRAEMFFVEEAVYARGLGLGPGILAWTEGPAPMLQALDERQRRRFLDPLLRAEITAAFAVTEPGAGSDVLGIRTRARRDGGDWVLTGHKAPITNTQYCDLALVAAVTDPDAGAERLTLFVVEADRAGFRRGRTYRTIMDDGLTGELFLDDVRVPDDHRVGAVGQGFALALAWINWRRLCRGGMCAGWGKYLLDGALRHAREREAYGRPIGHLGAVQAMVTDMYVDWYAARAVSLAAQWELDRLGPWTVPLPPEAVRLVATVKLVNDEAFYRIADRAVQVEGAAGLMKDNPVEKLFRIARNLRVPAGTDEVQKSVIARTLGLGRP